MNTPKPYRNREKKGANYKYFLWTFVIFASILVLANLTTCESKEVIYDSKSASETYNETLIHRIKTNGNYELVEIERRFPRTGEINTSVDGEDIGVVNLWSATTKDRLINASLPKGVRVRLLEYGEDYILVCKASDPHIWGWCMAEFIKLD